MLGITGILTIGVFTSAVVGILAKTRGVRIAAWSVTALCIIGLLLFACALPYLLRR
jgi:hypothetical protein